MTTPPLFHILDTCLEPPSQFTFPFCYIPHALSVEAARLTKEHIDSSGLLLDEPAGGKMFGVLVCRDNQGRLGFLAAYSGLLAGRNDLPFFVPPVYDAQQPDGHFKTQERIISAVNREIEAKEYSSELIELQERKTEICNYNRCEIETFKAIMAKAKKRRDELRKHNPDEATTAAMTQESQHQKAELRRLKATCRKRETEINAAIAKHRQAIDELKLQRRSMSDKLQEWLFRQYAMLNAYGERLDIIDIFKRYSGLTPPAGTGDCCAPKMLQYAFTHKLKPVCMAEFWWGKSPHTELRRHGHYYPSCSGKCKPLLSHMLQGIDVEPDPLVSPIERELPTVYDDDTITVVDKPAGMLSVPGNNNVESVLSIIQRRFPDAEGPLIVHRLDMDTSGLLVVAKTKTAHRLLQAQFEQHTTGKRYIALLQGIPSLPLSGIISLPMRADPDDRPRQTVDPIDGKPATTSYKIIATSNCRTLVELMPLTGRTHQLRVHCAHPDGLSCPIVGDKLYGIAGSRLCLHAAELTFIHPVTGVQLTVYSPRHEAWMNP